MAVLRSVDDDLTSTERAALETWLGAPLRSVQEVRLPEDQYFLEGLKASSPATFRGALVNLDLVREAATQVDLSTVPVLEPLVVHLGGEADEHDGHVQRLVAAGFSHDELAAIAMSTRQRTKFVFLPRAAALPVVATGSDRGRTIVAALAIPCGMDRVLTLMQAMPQFAVQMMTQLGAPSDRELYIEYWFEPMSVQAQNVKVFALRFATDKRRAALQCNLLPFTYMPVTK